MNGPHDLGGLHGLGPIDPEPEESESVFHHDWERRAMGLTVAAGFLGQWSIDTSRFSRERQHPVDYLRNSYYENWLAGLPTLLRESGLATDEELAEGQSAGPGPAKAVERCLKADRVAAVLAAGGPVDMEIEAEPAFAPGDRVRAKNRHPQGHTREPGYVKGRVGVIHEHYGAHVLPDRSAAGEKRGEHLYSVRFTGDELWGEDGDVRDAVYVDLWQSYLEPL